MRSSLSASGLLRPTGRGGRAVALAASTCIGGGVFFAVFMIGALSGTVLAPVLLLIGAGGVVVYGWLWLRFPWVGVWVDGEWIVVRSWWTSMCVPCDGVVRVRAESYSGWFYVVGLPIAGGVLELGALSLDTSDRGVVRLGGTVTWLRSARAQARALNVLLGVDMPRRDRGR